MTTLRYLFRDFSLDPAARELRRAGELVTLPTSALDCLAYLVANRDRAVGRDELIAAVWGRADVADALLAQTVLRIRRTLGDAGAEDSAIRTIARFGYRCENPKDLMDLYKRSRAEGFGEEVKRRIMVGTYALSAGYYDAYYLKAQKIRRLIKNDFVAAFNEVDVILGPTTPNPAWKLGEKANDPVAAYLEDIYTITANLAGIPGLSMPAGFVDGLPVGLQLIAPAFAEARLLNAAHQLQQATDWHTQEPQA